MEWIYDLVGPDDTAHDWNLRRERIRSRIVATLGPMPSPAPQRDLRVDETIPQDGFDQQRVSFLGEADDRITAWLLTPHSIDMPRPALICLHETAAEGKDRVMGTLPGKANLAYAPELARRGYVTLAPDIVSAGERVFEGHAPLDTSPFYAAFPDRTVEGKILWDHQRCVDLLQSLSQVNPRRIGAIGHSLGGRSAHYLAAHDPRIRATAMSCGICPNATTYRLFVQRNAYDPLPTRRAAVVEKGRLPFEKHELMAMIAPRALMVVSPANDPERRHDLISDMAVKVFEVYKLLQRPEAFVRLLHGFGHDTPPYIRESMYRWLDEYLNGPG